jgi:hypothetical protein
MPKPQNAAVVGFGCMPTTAGVTYAITAPMPPITVSIEKNSARNAIASARTLLSVIMVIDLNWKMNQPNAKPTAYSNQNSCQKLISTTRAITIAVMIPSPSPATQWITAPLTRRTIERSKSSCSRRFSSSLAASAMPGARAVARYRARPITEKNSTTMGHAHLIAVFRGVLTRRKSRHTHTAQAMPKRYQATTKAGSARKERNCMRHLGMSSHARRSAARRVCAHGVPSPQHRPTSRPGLCPSTANAA